MDVEVNEEQIRERMEGRFQSIRSWFVGEAGEESEAAKVFVPPMRLSGRLPVCRADQ